MKRFRLIVSEPGNGPDNMAFDETIFQTLAEEKFKYSSLRIYSWENPCVTIGYFQKHSDFISNKLPVTRRLTGGLAVHHANDISYAFTTNESDWQYIYGQNMSYRLIHAGIREALRLLGTNVEFSDNTSTSIKPANSLCVKTFFPYDLELNGRKIAGSSQRRRGKTLLQQGSIHLPENHDFNKVAGALKIGWEKALNVEFEANDLESYEMSLKDSLVRNKYSCCEWNEKF